MKNPIVRQKRSARRIQKIEKEIIQKEGIIYYSPKEVIQGIGRGFKAYYNFCMNKKRSYKKPQR